MMFDWAMTVLVHCFLLGGAVFMENWTSGVVLVVDVLQLQGIDHYSGIFFLLLFMFWMCASVMFSEYCIGTEAECNLYHVILIYSLCKKKNV